MYTTFQQLAAYFKALPTVMPDIKGVTVGHDDAIMDLQNTRIAYPHLWVETPDVRFVGTDHNPATRYLLNVAIITNEPLKHPDQGNAKLSAMLELMQSLWARILQDADEELFDLVLQDADGDPIRQWSADNVYGWRMQITIDLPRLECAVLPYVGIDTGLYEEHTYTTSAATYTYTIPAGKVLRAVYVSSDAALDFTLGTTPGGTELAGSIGILADNSVLAGGIDVVAGAATPVYFAGLAGNVTLKIYLN